uniref:Uncharacterized protein n=1 Tax=Solibacter usitatus (strain Ellin6076) TaxID=234267 RepID=Q01NH3_SOLUE
MEQIFPKSACQHCNNAAIAVRTQYPGYYSLDLLSTEGRIIRESPMSRVIESVPRVVFFLAGVAAAAVALPRRERAGMDPAAAEDLKTALANLESRIQARESADAARFAQVESRLEEHSAKLTDVPSTSQIVAAMEQLLSRTMASLDDRLSTQAHSIEILKSTVSQTDTLLERVLESLDSLQTYNDSSELAEDPLLSRPAV